MREADVDELVERPGVLDRVHDVGHITDVVGHGGVTISRNVIQLATTVFCCPYGCRPWTDTSSQALGVGDLLEQLDYLPGVHPDVKADQREAMRGRRTRTRPGCAPRLSAGPGIDAG